MGQNWELFGDNYKIAKSVNSNQFIATVSLKICATERRLLSDASMKSAETGHPIRQWVRDAEHETDPDTRAARAAGQGGTANGMILEYGNAPFRAAQSPDAAAGFGASAGSVDSAHRGDEVLPPSTSLAPLGRLGRTAALLFFMTIVFLAGLFIGASLIANLSTRPAPAGTAAIPPTIEPPTADPATTNGRASPEAATPQAGPTAVMPAESTTPQSTTATARSPAPIELVPAPKDDPAAVTATTTEGLPEPGRQLPNTGSTPLPPPPPDAAVPIVAAPTVATAAVATATVALPPGASASAAAPIVAVPVPATSPAEPSATAEESLPLMARGDELFAVGDVASARLFYERASEAGDAAAALRLGESYDPFFLAQARLNGVLGDPALAIRWYRRARDLGASEAEILLKSVENR